MPKHGFSANFLNIELISTPKYRISFPELQSFKIHFRLKPVLRENQQPDILYMEPAQSLSHRLKMGHVCLKSFLSQATFVQKISSGCEQEWEEGERVEGSGEICRRSKLGCPSSESVF